MSALVKPEYQVGRPDIAAQHCFHRAAAKENQSLPWANVALRLAQSRALTLPSPSIANISWRSAAFARTRRIST
jgi:hypothetical protein